MKNKYQRMNKEEKKQLLVDYINASEQNSTVAKHLKKSKIEAILGMILGLGLIIYSLITKTDAWWEYIAYGFIIVFCLLLYIKVGDFFGKQLNKFAIERDSKSKKTTKTKKD